MVSAILYLIGMIYVIYFFNDTNISIYSVVCRATFLNCQANWQRVVWQNTWHLENRSSRLQIKIRREANMFETISSTKATRSNVQKGG